MCTCLWSLAFNQGLGVRPQLQHSRTAHRLKSSLRSGAIGLRSSNRCTLAQPVPGLRQHAAAAHNSRIRQQSRASTVAVSAGKRSQPDRLLLQLLGGPDKAKQSSAATTTLDAGFDSLSSNPSSSGDGLFASLDQAGLGLPLRQGIINPNNKWYRAWWGLLIGAAAFTGIFVPWELGFGDMADYYSLSSVATWIDLILVALFMADIGK